MTRVLNRSRLPAVELIVAALFVIAATLGIAAGAEERAGELDGTWQLVAVEREGEVIELDDDLRWIIKDGKVFFGGELLAAVVLYPVSAPKGIDLAFHEPKNDYEGI